MFLYALFLCTSASQSVWVFSAAIKGPAVSLKLLCCYTQKSEWDCFSRWMYYSFVKCEEEMKCQG